MLYPTEDKKQLANVLKLASTGLTRFSIFMRHKYLKHVGAEYPGYHDMRYLFFLIPSTLLTIDATYYYHGSEFAIST